MKTAEPCPRCAAAVLPTDSVVPIEHRYGDVPLRLWRYLCACGWTWANAAQRLHNSTAYDKAHRAAEARSLW